MAISHDLGRLTTEQADPRFAHLDEMSVDQIVATMNAADFDVPAAIATALPAISAAIRSAEPRFVAGGRLVYVGAGTSGRLGVLDAAECPPTFQTDPSRVVGLIAGGRNALVDSTEGAEDDPAAGARDIDAAGIEAADVVVGLAASGRTPYVLGAVTRSRELGALTIGLACNSPAELSTVAELGIEIPVGPEVLAGSTRLKAGSVEKQVLNMISTALMVRAGRTYGNLMVDMAATNGKLRERAARLVSLIAEVDQATAIEALARADQQVKTAVVMLVRGEEAEAARTRLAAASGRLAAAIGVPSSAHPALNRPA